MHKVFLRVKKNKQAINECAIASVASLCHYYNKKIKYSKIRETIPHFARIGGLYDVEQGMLLNSLGFKNVNIVNCDLEIFDFSWNNLPKNQLLKKIKKVKKYYNKSFGFHSSVAPYSEQSQKKQELKQYSELFYSWLAQKKYNNNLIIDTDYAKYIKKSLNQGNPVIAGLNMTTLGKSQKEGSDIGGFQLFHSVIIRGYDDKNVYIVDSDSEKGYYSVKWTKLLPNIYYNLIYLD